MRIGNIIARTDVIRTMAHWPVILVFVMMVLNAQAQLVVNEACSKNLGHIQDGTGGSPEWIELYNPGSEPILLDGYYLSDDPQRLDRWPLPTHTLESGGYLVIFHGILIRILQILELLSLDLNSHSQLEHQAQFPTYF